MMPKPKLFFANVLNIFETETAATPYILLYRKTFQYRRFIASEQICVEACYNCPIAD